MPVKITFDETACAVRITNKFNSCLGQLAGEVLGDCNKYCKEREGILIASSYIHSQLDKGKLIWQTPYAKRQYWEIQTAIKDKNPQASWKWCEVAKQKHLAQWERQAQKLFENSTGKPGAANGFDNSK